MENIFHIVRIFWFFWQGEFRNDKNNAKKLCPTFIIEFRCGALTRVFSSFSRDLFSISANNSQFYKFSTSSRICKNAHCLQKSRKKLLKTLENTRKHSKTLENTRKQLYSIMNVGNNYCLIHKKWCNRGRRLQ